MLEAYKFGKTRTIKKIFFFKCLNLKPISSKGEELCMKEIPLCFRKFQCLVTLYGIIFRMKSRLHMKKYLGFMNELFVGWLFNENFSLKYRDVTFAGEGLHNLDLYAAQGGIFLMAHLM